MIRNYLTIFFVITAAATLSSCIGRPANVVSAPTSDSASEDTRRTKPVTIRAEVALIDATGSYGELVPALRRLARFALEELNPGDTFCAFWIKGDIGESPDFVIDPTTFPVPQRRIGDPAEIDALQLKQQINKTLCDYANGRKFKKAGQTDLLQSIAYAGRMLNAGENARREKWLLMFTDLEDNQRKNADLNLEGVHVRIFFVPARNDLNGLDQKMADWRQRLTEAKAASVDIYDVGQSETLSRLIANQ